MRKARNSKLALLLVFTMLATLFVGIGTASAAASYNVGSIAKVSAGPGQNLGRVIVTVPAAELNATTSDFFTLRLPTDFDFGLPVANGYVLTQVGATDVFNVNNPATNLQIRIPIVKNAFYDAATTTFGSASITVDVIAKNEIKIYVGSAAAVNANEKDGYIYIQMNSVTVDSSAPATIELAIEGRANSPFGDAKVAIAQYGSGTVAMSIDSAKTITTSTAACDIIRLKEDRPGAWVAGDDIKVKLPSGFKWTLPTSIVRSDGNGTAPTATLADDSRTLVFTRPAAGASTIADYFLVSGQTIIVDDESVAKLGEVEVSVSGKAASTPSNFVVAKYGDYSVKVDAFGDPKTVTAGRTGQEIGKFVIEEGIGGSLPAKKTITATLVGGAKWVSNGKVPTIDASNSKNVGAPLGGAGFTTWTIVGSTNDQLRLTLGNATSNSAIKAVFQKAEINVSPNADEEIKVVFSGSAGITGEVVVAKVVKPVTATVEGNVPDIVIGAQAAQLPTIVLTENKAEAFDATGSTSTLKSGYSSATNASGLTYYYIDVDGVAGFSAAGGDIPVTKEEATTTSTKNIVRIEFPDGVVPGQPTSVVADGLVIDRDSVARSVGSNNRWGIDIKIKSTSAKAGSIKISGVKVDLDRTVPQGDLKLAVKGTSLVQTLEAFPGLGSAATVKVANVITPAPGQTAGTAVFTIGNAKYSLNGAEIEMGANPYVKNGRTYLPLRFVGNAIGIDNNNIWWDAATKTATLKKDNTIVQVKIGSKSLLVNGVAVGSMDVAPEIKDGFTMLPIRPVVEAFGAQVDWDQTTQTATVSF